MALFGKPVEDGQRLAVVPQGRRLDVIGIEPRRNARPRVTRCESYPLEGGFATALARLRQGGKLGGHCATLLSPSDYQFLAVEAPPLPESAPQAELREAVRWKIKDMVDFPVTAAGVDALRIPPQPGRPPQLLAAAASHAILKPLIESFQNAKIDLFAICVPEIAQRNVARLYETPDRALALLSFSARSGLLTLSCNGELHATRRIDVGAEDLAADKSLYERAVLDVQRSLDNFDRNFSHLSLQRLLVVPVAGADDFIAHLRDNLYQPVEALVISDGLDIEATPMLANAATLADALPAIGVALGLNADAAGLNLYDPALQQQHDPWTARNLGLGLAASVLLCASWGGWAHWRQAGIEHELGSIEPQVQAARSEVLQLGKQISGYQPDSRLQAALDESRIRLESRTQVLALLRKGMSSDNDSPADFMRGFARQIPPGLWLTAFAINTDSGALEIHGRTIEPRQIPEYVRRLNAEQAFQGRTFSALEITSPARTGDAPPAAVAMPVASSPAQPGGAAPAAGDASGARYHEFALTSAQTGASGANGNQP